MSFIIDFLAGSWTTLLPILVGLFGGLFGVYQKSGKDKAKAEAAHKDMQYKGEKVRADISDETLAAIIEQQKKTDRVIHEKIKIAAHKRNHFSA